jgi:hypothetical protein
VTTERVELVKRRLPVEDVGWSVRDLQGRQSSEEDGSGRPSDCPGATEAGGHPAFVGGVMGHSRGEHSEVRRPAAHVEAREVGRPYGHARSACAFPQPSRVSSRASSRSPRNKRLIQPQSLRGPLVLPRQRVPRVERRQPRVGDRREALVGQRVPLAAAGERLDGIRVQMSASTAGTRSGPSRGSSGAVLPSGDCRDPR